MGDKANKLAAGFICFFEPQEELRVCDRGIGVFCETLNERGSYHVERLGFLRLEQQDRGDLRTCDQRHSQLTLATGQHLHVIRVTGDLHRRNQGCLPGAEHLAHDTEGSRIGFPHLEDAFRIANAARDFKARWVRMNQHQRPGIRAGLTNGVINGQVHHALEVKRAIQFLVDTLHIVKLLDTLSQRFVGHLEQTRIFNGDGSLSRERGQQVHFVFHECRAVALIDYFENANHARSCGQRNRQNRAGRKLALVGFTLIDLTEPTVILLCIIDNHMTPGLNHGTGNTAAGRDTAANKFLPGAAHRKLKDQVAREFFTQQQTPCFTAQNLDGGLSNNL